MHDRHRRPSAHRTPASLSDQAGIARDGRRPAPLGPSESFDRKELQNVFADALERPPLEQRTTLSLVIREELSYRDAAGVLGCCGTDTIRAVT